MKFKIIRQSISSRGGGIDMNKTVKFQVELDLSEKISSDDETNDMAQSIADAIVHACNTIGITPEHSDVYVEGVYVREWYSDKQIIEHP